MDKTSNKPIRKQSLRLEGYDYSLEGAYFVTVVTRKRANLFGDVVNETIQLSPLGELLEQCWYAIPHHFPSTILGSFMIMPNHVHGIIIIKDQAVGARHASPLLGTIIGSFKSAVSRQAGNVLGINNIWQRYYYVHIIRDQQDLEQITSYILDNPRQWNEDEENPNNSQIKYST